jgi:hypothetical protein
MTMGSNYRRRAVSQAELQDLNTTIPTNLISPTMQVTVDGGISTVVVPAELLPNLSPANTLPYSPLVP